MPAARKPPPKRVAKPKKTITLAAWALSIADALDKGAHGSLDVDELPPRIALCIERFGLDATERAIVLLLGAAEGSLVVARRLRALAGTPISVEIVRALVETMGLGGVIEALAPDRRLRQHALVHVERAGNVGATDPLRLETGLWPPMRLASEFSIEAIEPGVELGDVKEVPRFHGVVPTVALLDQVGAGSERATARAVATSAGRKVLLWWPLGTDVRAVARLRREIDLDGVALFVAGPFEDALSLGRALTTAPPTNASAQPLVVCTNLALDEACVRAPFVLRREKSVSRPAAAAEGSIDYVRQLAQRDADRALGIVRAPPPPPRPVVPGRIVDASVRAPEPPRPEPEPIKVEAPPAPEAKVEEPPKVEVAPAPAPDASGLSATADGPRLELAANADLATRARVLMTSPSAEQRIEIMSSFDKLKSSTIVPAVRLNTKSEHAGVRAKAEALMLKMFGESWNRTREIPKPIQPPRSDDEGRGPPGA